METLQAKRQRILNEKSKNGSDIQWRNLEIHDLVMHEFVDLPFSSNAIPPGGDSDALLAFAGSGAETACDTPDRIEGKNLPV